jgi:hypothetical protein
MVLHAHRGWTMGPLMATVQRHNLTPSTWSSPPSIIRYRPNGTPVFVLRSQSLKKRNMHKTSCSAKLKDRHVKPTRQHYSWTECKGVGWLQPVQVMDQLRFSVNAVMNLWFTQNGEFDIWCSQGGEVVNFGVLRCDIIKFCKWFRRNVLLHLQDRRRSRSPYDGGTKRLVGQFLPRYTGQHPRRQSSSIKT